MHPIVAERITKGDGYTLKKALTLVALVSMFALLGWSDAWDKKTILTPLITVEKPTVAQVCKPTPPPPPAAQPQAPRTTEQAIEWRCRQPPILCPRSRLPVSWPWRRDLGSGVSRLDQAGLTAMSRPSGQVALTLMGLTACLSGQAPPGVTGLLDCQGGQAGSARCSRSPGKILPLRSAAH